MTTYVCRPSRNRYVSSAIFLSFNIRAPLSRLCEDRLVTVARSRLPARRRPFTGFLYYGPFGLSYLLTIHFVWTYMGTLEKLQFAEPSAAVSVRLASAAPEVAAATEEDESFRRSVEDRMSAAGTSLLGAPPPGYVSHNHLFMEMVSVKGFDVPAIAVEYELVLPLGWRHSTSQQRGFVPPDEADFFSSGTLNWEPKANELPKCIRGSTQIAKVRSQVSASVRDLLLHPELDEATGATPLTKIIAALILLLLLTFVTSHSHPRSFVDFLGRSGCRHYRY